MTQEKKKNQRIALLKDERLSDVGVELISLCQGVTEDGRLMDEEIHQLNEWLTSNADSDISTVHKLAEIVNQILKDETVSDAERKALHQTLERVLPPDIRRVASVTRRELLAEEREVKKKQKTAEQEKRKRNRPLGSFSFTVAGAFAENRPSTIRRHVSIGDPVRFERDPTNRHSRNAVKVMTAGAHEVGFVPEEDAIDMAPLLDSRTVYQANFANVFTGGRTPVPLVKALFYSADSDMAAKIKSKAKYGLWNTNTTVWLLLVAVLILFYLLR